MGRQYETPDVPMARAYYSGTDQLTRGALLAYASDASGAHADFKGFQPGMAVEKPAGSDDHFFAGVVADSSVGITGPAWIDIQRPRPGDVVTIAVAADIDTGDGVVLQAQYYGADGGAWAAGDIFACLYDEATANNPHGQDYFSASAGLVEAVFTGV